MISIKTEHSGADYLQETLNIELSDIGRNTADLLGVVFDGIHHIRRPILAEVDWGNPYGIVLRLENEFATYDSNRLTRLVVLAHDMAIRVSIEPSTNFSFLLRFFPRERAATLPSGAGHPSLDHAVAQIRKAYTQ
jgi:hypothetical protein